MIRDYTASNDERLVYREGPHYWFGFLVLAVGLSGMFGTSSKLFSSWPNNSTALIGGVVLCALMVYLGIQQLFHSQVVLDKTAKEMIRSSALLFWRRATAVSLPKLTSVSWRPSRVLGGTEYSVQLSAPNRDVELFQVQRMTDARRIVREIGEFFDTKQEHWDQAILRAEESTELPHSIGVQQIMWRIVGRQPLRCVSRSKSNLICVQTFGSLLKVFGVMFGLMGLLFLFSHLLHFNVGGLSEAPWATTVVGSVFFLSALILLLGRCGVTIDKNKGIVGRWWGLWIPFVVARGKLATFYAVGLQRCLEEGVDFPFVISRVFLVGTRGEKLMLYGSSDSNETKSLASEIADFLKWPIVEELPPNGIETDGPLGCNN